MRVKTIEAWSGPIDTFHGPVAGTCRRALLFLVKVYIVILFLLEVLTTHI